MHETKRFEIAVTYNIISLEDEDILNEDTVSSKPIEETIIISIECNELDFPENCEELDDVISKNEQYVGLYSAVIETIAEQNNINAEQVDLVRDPTNCTPL